jgi:glycosyltransferase involved in cell wall biosynthesis
MAACSRNMRVLVIGRLTSIHTVRFCEELQRQGAAVAVLWIGKATARPNVRVYHTDRNMRIFRIPHTATIGCLLYIRNAIQDFRPHVIHVQDDGQMAYWLNLICPSKIVRAYTNWGHNQELVRCSKVRRGLAKTDLVTSDAQDVLEEILPFAPSAKQQIVRFGADRNLFSFGSPDKEVLAKYSLNPDGTYVISPRSIRPIYNQMTLIKALPPVLESFPGLKVILKHHHVQNYNDSRDYENQLRNEAERLRIWDRIIRLDHIPYADMCHLFRLCRAAVSIPLEDGFPATIFEAMASGCPLIVSNDKSYEGVINEKNAIPISPTDSRALASALIRILGEPAFTEGIRKEALRTVSEKGDFGKEISGLLGTYQSLLSERKRLV